MLKFFAIILIQILCITPAYCFSQKDSAVFKDAENGFTIKYPKSWVKQKPTQEKTKFKIISKNGKGNEECSVNVQYSPNLASRTPRDFIDSLKEATKEQLQASVRKGIPNAVIINMGETTLNNQPAFFQHFSFTHDAVGNNPYAAYGVMTINNGGAYTVMCICEQKSFDKNLRIFKQIISSFSLSK
ncbi:MAG: PsbP [Smithella sp. PtaU1.Bin162]|nr:MAG: PsbP [Smithella sp. PtaU1.Bin162]